MVTSSKPQTYIYKSETDTQYRVGTYQEPVNESYEDKLKRLSKYEPVIPQAPLDTRFHSQSEDGTLGIKAKLHLVRSVDELRELAKQAVGKVVGMDTETTGLSFYKDKIVGFSFAFNDMEGWYVPIRHQVRTTTVVKENLTDENGNFLYTKTGRVRQHQVKTHVDKPYPKNLPDKECLDILYEMMLSAKYTLWHNSEFDLNMIKAEGYDVIKCKTFDTMILPYIYDAEGKGIAGLKALEKRLLGRYRVGFKETVGSDENFQFTDPEKSYAYASVDACHDDSTEVLTRNGWVFWKDYKGDIPLATPNINTNKLEWQLPTRLVNYHYSGNMYHYLTKTQDWCVTPNHNMLIRHNQKADGVIEFKQADALKVEETLYLGSTEIDGEKDKYLIGDYEISEVDLARLVALILADGCTQKYDKETHNQYHTQIVMSEFKNYDIIRSFLDRLDFPKTHIYHRQSSVNKVNLYHWKTHYKPLWDLLRPCTEGGSRNKYIPNFIFNMSSEAIREFIKFYGYCDGHKQLRDSGAYSVCICTVSPYLRDGIQMLLSMIGIPSMLGSRPPKDVNISGRIIKAENCAEQYFINYNSRRTRRIKRCSMNIEHYDGMVYCAEVPNHTLITRRNGKVLVSGNCSVVAIHKKLYPMVRELLAQAPSIIELDGKPYDIVQEDNNLIRAFVDYYGHATMKIDSAEARRYEKMVKEGLNKVTEEIYAYFGRGPFNLSTQSKEFKQVMADAHIDTGAITEKSKTIAYGKTGIKEYTRNLGYLKNNVFPNIKYIKFNTEDKNGSKLPKNGYNMMIGGIVGNLVRIIKTYGRDYCKWTDQVNNLVIKNLDGSKCSRMDFYQILKNMYHGEMKKLGVLQKIKDYSSYMKALNSYIAKLTEVDEARMHYNITASTASGRLSSGNSSRGKNKENSYYINLNAQNLTKPKQVFYEATPSDEPDNILGYKFTYVSDDYAHANKDTKIIVEAGSPDANIRKCIVAPEGRYVVSMDFCVSPETTIELEDGSVQPITCLENNPQKVKTPNGFEMAHNFHYTGKKQKCILTLKDGKKIVCSPDHKFLVRVGETEAVWKPLREIKSTDVILN